MTPEVAYVEPPDGPFIIGGNTDSPIWLFGAYRVALGDFRAMIPHSGFYDHGSIHDDPDFRASLIDTAQRMRDSLPNP